MSKYVEVEIKDINYKAMHTDHSEEIMVLRQRAALLEAHAETPPTVQEAMIIEGLNCAAALLEVHDDTGISLDDWTGPYQLVRAALMECDLDPDRLLKNGV